MKTGIFKWMGMALMALTFVACSKDDDDSSGGGTANGTMKGTVDGAVINCNLSVQAVYQSNVLSLAGRTNDGKGFTLALVSYTGTTGSFPINTGSFNNAILTLGTTANDSYSASGAAGSGTITISSFASDKVVGTFEFTGRNNAGATKAVTAGSFDIKR